MQLLYLWWTIGRRAMKLGNAKINKNTKRYQNETIYNDNKTEWSTIRPVIIGVVHKIRRLRSFEVLINNTTMGFWGLGVLTRVTKNCLS